MKFFFVFLLSLISAECYSAAPPVTHYYDATPAGTSKSDTRIYAGLGWTFGVKAAFETMIGIGSSHVNSSGNVTGADVGASAALMSFDSVKIKAKYINVTINGQGELGLGYAFGPGKILGTAGFNLPYFNAGADYVIDNGFEPFVGVTTMDRLSRPGLTYSCTGHPATLSGTTCSY